MGTIDLQGKYDTAKIFTENVDEVTIGQILNFLNQPFAKGANTRIMPDCHAGKGAVIGTTMKVTDKIVPNLVGVDIGCGMVAVEIAKTDLDFAALDEVIRKTVPSGSSIRNHIHPYARYLRLEESVASFDTNRALHGLGTLGGGNHFIELNEAEDGRLFLVIHSGSRHLGVKVATHHQNQAIRSFQKNRLAREQLIAEMREAGKQKEIQRALQTLKATVSPTPTELMYVEGVEMNEYLHDVAIAQEYAKWNRAAMVQVILQGMGWKERGRLDTIHNYVDLEQMILRKGAISARKGEQVLIPINMRDGSILATGKGNDDWNQSAPHGAGRILSRSKAKETLSLSDFQETMGGIYTTCVHPQTLDESPFAYKPMDEIIENTRDAIEIDAILKPLYNFKAVNG